MSRLSFSRKYDFHSSRLTIKPLIAVASENFAMTLSPSFPGEVVIVRGKVVHGFGRGSKQLGFPTANLDSLEAKAFAAKYSTGIYAGWAKVVGGRDSHVYPAAISVGWNPT